MRSEIAHKLYHGAHAGGKYQLACLAIPGGYRSRPMELRHLRYFIAVAEEQNVTRAAARLHVSQPPLTRQIHDLEHELGFALFSRTGKSLHLTDAGRVFLEEAQAVLNRLNVAITTARSAATGHQGELHVGYAPSPTAAFLPGALQSFQRRCPGVRVVLHDQSSPEMIAGLREHRLHAALLMEPPRQAAKDLVFEPLRTHAIVIALPPNHRLARRRTLTVGEVMAEPLVALSRKDYPDYHTLLARVLGPKVKRMRFAEECDSGMSVVAAVAAGKGIALAIAGLADTAGKRLQFVPLSPAPPHSVVGVAYLEDALNPTTSAFLDAVRAERAT